MFKRIKKLRPPPEPIGGYAPTPLSLKERLEARHSGLTDQLRAVEETLEQLRLMPNCERFAELLRDLQIEL